MTLKVACLLIGTSPPINGRSYTFNLGRLPCRIHNTPNMIYTTQIARLDGKTSHGAST